MSSVAGEIRYTLDGSEPGTNAALYERPLLLTNSAVLKARAISAGRGVGPTASGIYTLIETNLAAFSSPLPLIVINTFGHAIPAPGNAPPAWMQAINTGAVQRTTLLQSTEHTSRVQLKPRGFTSLRNPKKSYSLETQDERGKDIAVPLLGMPADSDWVLYAPYADKTLIRDVLAYELSRQLGHYASRTRFVEVFLNDTTNKLSAAHYVGVYVLEERVKVAPHRVALHKLSAKDNAEPQVAGGYLFKKDHLEKVRAEVSGDEPIRTAPPRLPGWFPTGPGGFPAAASGFQPSVEPAVFANAHSIITNAVAITNFLAGTNEIVAPPSVTVVRTNSIVSTNLLSMTNLVLTTNLVVATNTHVATNLTAATKTIIATNLIVTTQAVAGTNTIAATNSVDPHTIVITTTVSITTSATYRTNFLVSTNTVAVTNFTLVTNAVVMTNSLVATNVLLTNVPVFTTNHVLITNLFTLGPAEPPPASARLVASGEGFVTSHASPFFFVEPKPSKITPAQRSWLTNYLNQFEAALYGRDFRSPTNGYAAFIDVDSFIDQHLFVEATKNIDGFRFSTYFTKDRGAKLKMEPIWDWNLSWGNSRGKQGYMAEQWYWPQLNDQQYSWYRRLFEDADFGQRYVDRWAQWRTNVFKDANLLRRVDELTAALKEPAARNFERWPILGVAVEPNYFVGKSYDEEIQNLKSWMTNRLAWIDAQFVPPPVMSSLPVTAPTNTLSFIAPTGQVYFTLDGSDPRLTNGQVSGSAQMYQAPVAVTNKTRVVARVRNKNGWSSPIAGRVATR